MSGAETRPAPPLDSLRVLIVDDEQDIRLGLRRLLAPLGASIHEAADGVGALRAFDADSFDLVLTDLMMPRMGGAELLAEVKRLRPETTVVILTGFGTVQAAVSCLQGGAAHFLTKPFDNDEIVRLVRRVGSRIRAGRTPSRPFSRPLIAVDARMERLLALIRRVAPTPVPVLIEGESGTGKEVVAHALHEQSRVAGRPFLAVNAAALTETLLESELFGHEKGAFTGAERAREGLFAEAKGGTVFLDEIASMSPPFQGKLLRVLQEKVVRPVGASADVRVDFRLIAASNKDVAQMVKDGTFREDLYYRLRVVSLTVPPLRQRPGDVIPLALHFLAKDAEVCLAPGEPVPELSDAAAAALQQHAWPGNVRELENAMQRALIVCAGERILPHHLGLDGEAEAPPEEGETRYDDAKKRTLERFQREFVSRALERTHGNVSQAAETCGMTRAALQKIMRQLGIDRGAFV